MARFFAFFTLFHLSLTFFRPEVPFKFVHEIREKFFHKFDRECMHEFMPEDCQHVFDLSAQTLRRRRLKLGDF